MASVNTLKNHISSGKMMVIAALMPPKDASFAALKEQAARLNGKVHAIGVSDNRDKVAMSATAAATLLTNEGFETVLHMVTRDRNRIALESDFLGANALGLFNILCTTGTHQTLGAFKSAKNVFDIDSVQLLKMISEHKAASESVCLGAAASPFADPMELQLIRLEKKVHLGASFVITQPVFDMARFEAWWQEVKKPGLHQKTAFIAGIRPFLSREQAAKIAAKRPSPRVPAELLGRITGASSEAEARKEGIAVAVSTIEKLKALSGLRGFEICADEDVNAAVEIIDKAGLRIA